MDDINMRQRLYRVYYETDPLIRSIFKDYTKELYTNCTSLHAKHFLVRCKCCLSRCYNCASCEPSACWALLFFWQACQRVLGWATHFCETAVLTCRHKLALERDRFMVYQLTTSSLLQCFNHENNLN